MRRKVSASLEEKYLGFEPTWTDEVASSIQLDKAYNWYNYTYGKKTASNLLFDNYPENRDKKEVAFLKKINSYKIDCVTCYNARMIFMGCKLPEKVLEKMNEKLDEYVKLGKSINKEVTIKDNENVVSIQDRIREKTNEYISEMETELDTFYLNNYKNISKFNMYTWLQTNNVKPQHAIAIHRYYQLILQEMNDTRKKTDSQLVEAYSNLTPAQLNNYIEFLENIVHDSGTWSKNQKTVRKARKKKPISIEKQLSHLKYLKESKEYKIVSVNPADILGANQLWAFNVKYRKLIRYDALGSTGFSFKGTTLTGWDKDNSISKTVRKPEKTLATILSGGKIILRKLMNEINSKECAPNGRINKDIILLKVIK